MNRQYAIYDLKTGHVRQTHVEVDASGRSKQLSEDEVLSMLAPHIQRDTVGVIAVDRKLKSGELLRIDPKTRKVAAP